MARSAASMLYVLMTMPGCVSSTSMTFCAASADVAESADNANDAPKKNFLAPGINFIGTS